MRYASIHIAQCTCVLSERPVQTTFDEIFPQSVIYNARFSDRYLQRTVSGKIRQALKKFGRDLLECFVWMNIFMSWHFVTKIFFRWKRSAEVVKPILFIF